MDAENLEDILTPPEGYSSPEEEPSRVGNLPPVPWRVLDVAAAALALIVGVLGILIILALAIDNVDANSALFVNVSLALVSALLLLTAWFFGPARRGVSVAALGLRRPCDSAPSQLLLPLGVLVAVLGFNAVYGLVVTALGWEALQPPEVPFASYEAIPLAFTGLLIILIAPFAEEVFFRGFVLGALARRWGLAAGVAASSLMFSLAHGSWALLIPAFVAGALLSWLYIRTGSLRASVLVHAMQNGVAFAATLAIAS